MQACRVQCFSLALLQAPCKRAVFNSCSSIFNLSRTAGAVLRVAVLAGTSPMAAARQKGASFQKNNSTRFVLCFLLLGHHQHALIVRFVKDVEFADPF